VARVRPYLPTLRLNPVARPGERAPAIRPYPYGGLAAGGRAVARACSGELNDGNERKSTWLRIEQVRKEGAEKMALRTNFFITSHL